MISRSITLIPTVQRPYEERRLKPERTRFLRISHPIPPAPITRMLLFSIFNPMLQSQSVSYGFVPSIVELYAITPSQPLKKTERERRVFRLFPRASLLLHPREETLQRTPLYVVMSDSNPNPSSPLSFQRKSVKRQSTPW